MPIGEKRKENSVQPTNNTIWSNERFDGENEVREKFTKCISKRCVIIRDHYVIRANCWVELLGGCCM